MDIVNSEKIEETFGINGYYGDGQMMNWFAPPTTIQNVRGVDYESTPHGVPTDEFWWIKQNRYNRERIANNLKNTTVIYPTGLPSGDRLEDDYFNAEGDKSKFVFIKPFSTKIAVGGVVGVSTYSKKIGDMIDGELYYEKDTKSEPKVKVLINANPIQGADGFVYIPLSYLSKEEPKAEPSKVEVSKLSDDKILGMPKMVAIGVGVVILAIGGFIVYKKFIKK